MQQCRHKLEKRRRPDDRNVGSAKKEALLVHATAEKIPIERRNYSREPIASSSGAGDPRRSRFGRCVTRWTVEAGVEAEEVSASPRQKRKRYQQVCRWLAPVPTSKPTKAHETGTTAPAQVCRIDGRCRTSRA
jgi:hypothetical protein